MKMNKRGQNLAENKLMVLILVVLVLVLVIMAIFRFDLINRFKNLPGYSYSQEDKLIDYTKLTDAQVLDLFGKPVGQFKIDGTFGSREYYIFLFENGNLVRTKFYLRGTNIMGDIYIDEWGLDDKVAKIDKNFVSVLSGAIESLSEPQKSQLVRLDQSQDIGNNQLYKRVAK
ncbi:MAG: hypothetical protein WCK90_00670 [archaeon]